MSDDTADRMPRTAVNGADYRVKAKHPRREGPLVITDAAGKVIAASGDTCAMCTQDQLASMIRNGYVERIDTTDTPPAPAPVPVAPPTPSRPRRRSMDRET
jgi:hypothetical protein